MLHTACQAFPSPLSLFFAPIVVFELIRLFALVVFFVDSIVQTPSFLACPDGAVHPLSFCCSVSVERLIRYHVYPWSGSSAIMLFSGELVVCNCR
jgi:hypothetical protein